MTFSSNIVSNAHCKYVTVCIIVYANVYNEIGEKRYNVVHVLNMKKKSIVGYNFCIERPIIIKNKYLNRKKTVIPYNICQNYCDTSIWYRGTHNKSEELEENCSLFCV